MLNVFYHVVKTFFKRTSDILDLDLEGIAWGKEIIRAVSARSLFRISTSVNGSELESKGVPAYHHRVHITLTGQKNDERIKKHPFLTACRRVPGG